MILLAIIVLALVFSTTTKYDVHHQASINKAMNDREQRLYRIIAYFQGMY